VKTKEQKRRYSRRWYLKNRDRLLNLSPEKKKHIKKYQKEYRKNNAEKRSKNGKQWRRKHPIKTKRYYKK